MKRVVIIGGGPAGSTAAYALMKASVPSVVLEQDARVGHARTVDYKGYLFDIGGHRFFTRIPDVQAIWREVMADRFLRVKRLSRILYRGRFFHYPLKPLEALREMGLSRARAWDHVPRPRVLLQRRRLALELEGRPPRGDRPLRDRQAAVS